MYIYAVAAWVYPNLRPFALELARAMKVERHNAIRQLVTTRVVTSQDELRRLLLKRGHEVTQATLSRDLHALRLFKGPGGYQIPSAVAVNHDKDLPQIADILRNFGLRVRQAMNQLVVITTKGSAQPVAAGIDDEGWPEVVAPSPGTTPCWSYARMRKARPP